MEGAGIPSLSPPYKKRKLSSSTSIEDLKEDEVVEILVRLPLKSVFRCKCVSKNWLGLISDACFIRSYIKRRKQQRRDQFIAYHVHPNWRSNLDTYGHLPVRLPDDDDDEEEYPIISDDGSGLDFSFSFIPKLKRRGDPDPNPFRCFEMVTMCHGLVLCNEQFRPPGYPPDEGTYYVCNPLTKQWLRIPPAPALGSGFESGQVGFMCYARAPSRDTTPHEVDFIVLEVQSRDKDDKDKDDFFWVRVFCSNTGRWTNNRVAGPPGMGSRWSSRGSSSSVTYNYGSVVVHRGMFHWRGGSWLVAYDPLNRPHTCKTIPIPGPIANRAMEEDDVDYHYYSRVELIEGCIRIAAYSLWERTFSVYQLSDYDNCKWDLKCAFRAPSYVEFSFCSPTNGDIMCVRAHHGDRLVLELVDLETGSTRTQLDIPQAQCHPNTCLANKPYAADFFVMPAWPTLIPQLPSN